MPLASLALDHDLGGVVEQSVHFLAIVAVVLDEGLHGGVIQPLLLRDLALCQLEHGKVVDDVDAVVLGEAVPALIVARMML